MNRCVAVLFVPLFVMSVLSTSNAQVVVNGSASFLAQGCDWQNAAITVAESYPADFPGESNNGKYYYYDLKIKLPTSAYFVYNTDIVNNPIVVSINGGLGGNVSVNTGLSISITQQELTIPLRCNGMNNPVLDEIVISGMKTKVATCPSSGGSGLVSVYVVPSAPVVSITGLPASLAMSTNGALPVELVSFTALRRNDVVALKWSTATETNNYGFDIERSYDRENWEAIGFVAGSGTTSSQRDYTFDARLNQRDMQQELVSFRLRQIDRDGSIDYSPVVSVAPAVVAGAVELKQNFPNPFNPATNISFNLPESDLVSLSVYNELGVEVARIHDGAPLERGWHTASFNATELPSGLYMYRLQTSAGTSSRTMMLMK